VQGGRPQQWSEELLHFAIEHGMSTFILISDDPDTIELFGREVAPSLREAVRRERGTETIAPGNE
jgi:hypothetical protein